MAETEGRKRPGTEEERRDLKRLMRGMVEAAKQGLVKVRFAVDSDDWPDVDGEWLWAEPVAGREPPQAVLQNIPCHVDGVSRSDSVLVRQDEKDPKGFLRFAGVAARGGHSTFVVLTPPDSDEVAARWPRLQALGCGCEHGTCDTRFGPKKTFSIDVPPEADIAAVLAVLDQGAREGAWMFRGNCIVHKLPPSLGVRRP